MQGWFTWRKTQARRQRRWG